jgi:hypothetical protein
LSRNAAQNYIRYNPLGIEVMTPVRIHRTNMADCGSSYAVGLQGCNGGRQVGFSSLRFLEDLSECTSTPVQ